MGYSYAAIAGFALDALIEKLQQRGHDDRATNSWFYNNITYFYRRGRKSSNGSITGSVWKMLPDSIYCRKVGPFKVDSNGDILRFPTSTHFQRVHATVIAYQKFEEKFGYPHRNAEIILT